MVTTKNIVVSRKKDLEAIQNHEEGEMAMCEDTNEIFMWNKEKGWTQVENFNKGFELNLYDLNKNLITQLEPLDFNEIYQKRELIENYYNMSNSVYHMLLCRDYGYYTLFCHNDIMMTDFFNFSDALFTIITELGNVYSIESNEDGAIEIWIKPNGEEDPYAFYLFPYDTGVVYYG